MLRSCLTILVCFSCMASFSQTFTGVVFDKETGQPLPFADVYFVELKTGTTTDSSGVFTIDHYKQKRIHIQISYIGYQTFDEEIDLTKGGRQEFYLEPGHFELEEVVIAVPTGKLQGEHIVSIEHKSMQSLQPHAAAGLAEAISQIPGVEQNSTGPGIGKPVIRGLSGNRIVTYAQGIRIENQQWGAEHGLGVGEVGIESVEVLKGPNSLLYGSDALGGVLYFIDERYARHDAVEGYAQTRFHSNTLGSSNQLGLKAHKGKFKLNLFGGYATHADYRIPGLGRVLNTRFDEKNVKSAFGFNTNNWIANIRYSFLQNNFGIAEDASYTEEVDRSHELPFQTINNHNTSLENIFFLGSSKLNLTLGYTHNYRREFEEDPQEHALGMRLSTFTYNLRWKSPTINQHLSLIVGAQGMEQSNKNNGEEILIPDARTADLGGYVLANMEWGKLQLQAGLRADARQIHTRETEGEGEIIPAIDKTYTGFTFSAGMVYALERISLRTNLSSGYRAPNTSELLSRGVHEGTNRYELGNANLKSEQATQIDFTLNYRDEHVDFAINPFLNTIRDYIFLSPTDTVIDGSPVFEYLQTDAYLFGGEMGVHLHPHHIHWLHIESNLSMVFGEDRQGNALPLIPATRLQSTLSIETKKTNKIRLKSVFVQHMYKFRQGRVSLFETPTAAYHLLNAGVQMAIPARRQALEVSAGVKNILNTRYIDHLSRFKAMGIPNPGINVYAAINFRFNGQIK